MGTAFSEPLIVGGGVVEMGGQAEEATPLPAGDGGGVALFGQGSLQRVRGILVRGDASGQWNQASGSRSASSRKRC